MEWRRFRRCGCKLQEDEMSYCRWKIKEALQNERPYEHANPGSEKDHPNKWFPKISIKDSCSSVL